MGKSRAESVQDVANSALVTKAPASGGDSPTACPPFAGAVPSLPPNLQSLNLLLLWSGGPGTERWLPPA